MLLVFLYTFISYFVLVSKVFLSLIPGEAREGTRSRDGKEATWRRQSIPPSCTRQENVDGARQGGRTGQGTGAYLDELTVMEGIFLLILPIGVV